MLKNNLRTPFKKKTGYRLSVFTQLKKGTALAVPFSMIPG